MQTRTHADADAGRMPSHLALGNLALRQGHYEAAIEHYEQATRESAGMAALVEFNLGFARRKLQAGAAPPTPPPGGAAEADAGMEQIRPHFDADYYLAQYPDVAEAGMDPLVHYWHTGWREGRDPHPAFSTTGYLRANFDVAQAGVNPYWHYVVAGRAEGRGMTAAPEAAPAEAARTVEGQVAGAVAEPAGEGMPEDWLEQLRPHFDARHYLAQYPDVAAAGVDPLAHYCAAGWREGRDPHPGFSTRYYLESNPDVLDAGVNPYWHYVVAGRAEGRRAKHPGGHKAEILKGLPTLEETVRLWKRRTPAGELLDETALAAALREATAQAGNALLLSFGHDDYLTVSGGVQLCIQREAQSAREAGMTYLNLHPWQPLPRLARTEDDADPLLCVTLDGRPLGAIPVQRLAAVLGAMAATLPESHLVVHSLLGHRPEDVVELARQTGARRCWFWLHDFLTLCPGYALQRNTITYCGAPPPDSNACRLCVFGGERGEHLERLRALFEALAVEVIAPAEITRTFWENKAALPHAGVHVQPHVELDWSRRARPRRAPRRARVTVGYIGAPVPHKGWPTFAHLVQTLLPSGRYRFVYFGHHAIALPDEVERVPVHVTAGEPHAMVDAIAAHDVDLVVHWGSCRETFSFSTYEALAGDAFVVTHPGSGNVADTVTRLGRGAVLDDDAALLAFFESDGARALAQARREAVRGLAVRRRLSGMAVPLIGAAQAAGNAARQAAPRERRAAP